MYKPTLKSIMYQLIEVEDGSRSIVMDRRMGYKFYPIRLFVASPSSTDDDAAGIRYHRTTTVTDRQLG